MHITFNNGNFSSNTPPLSRRATRVLGLLVQLKLEMGHYKIMIEWAINCGID